MTMFSEEMEVQVNVSQDGGEKIVNTTKDGYKWWGYKGANETWKPFRIPYKAKTNEPYYEDKPLSYSVSHFEAIGLTGWNWVKQESLWVGFDFDSITNHIKGLGSNELNIIRKSVEEISWVTVRRSTSGKGLHLYIFLDPPIQTKSHTEHAALAKAILSILSARVGIGLEARVDTCGGILWIWHKKATEEGYLLVKQGGYLNDVPVNWQDYIEVTSKKRRKIKPPVSEDDEYDLEELAAKTKIAKLDDKHRELMGWLASHNAYWWWDSDRTLLVAHTFDLAQAHRELKLKGPFYTVSQGKEHGHDQNCFGFPLRNGGWVFRRHTRRTLEHPCWSLDTGGWTRTYYNVAADLATVCRCHGGVERADGKFQLNTLHEALKVLSDLSTPPFEIQDWLKHKPAQLKTYKDGRVVLSVRKDSSDPMPEGWYTNKGGDWERIINTMVDDNIEVEVPDDIVRKVIVNGKHQGWYIFVRNMWIADHEDNIRKAMIALGYSNKIIPTMLGQCTLQPWELVVSPFKEEYPGNRKWNKDSPQLAFEPEEGDWSNWRRVYDHVGQGLDGAVRESQWCKDNDITTGSGYLLLWIASLFQFPLDQLPYLFFFGPFNSGKSIFHESLQLLLRGSRGYRKAEVALTNPNRFNAELYNAVICVVEEINLMKNREAYNRIKDWVTGKVILIHEKGETPYEATNSTHWIQCSNDPLACPVSVGDTRVVFCPVETLPKPSIPKTEFLSRLEMEAPAFLHKIFNLDIPKTPDRLRIPVIDTIEKYDYAEDPELVVRTFLEERTFPIMGAKIPLQELYNQFIEWLRINSTAKRDWEYTTFKRYIPRKYQKGKLRPGQMYLINFSFDPNEKPGVPLTIAFDKIVELL